MTNISNSKKILIYLNFLKSGAGKSAAAYANELIKNGYDVNVVSSISSPNISGMLDRKINVNVTAAKTTYRKIQSLCVTLKEYNPDVVLVVGGGNAYVYLAASLLSCTKSKLVIREAVSPKILIESEDYYSIRILKKILLKKAYNKSEMVISLTESMRNEIIKYWGVKEDRVALIPNGVVVPTRIHRAMGYSAIPIILNVGRLRPQKDHETLLRAFAIVRRERPCCLVVAGDGNERERLKSIICELGIKSDVQLLGQVDDVSPLYRKASLTVLSSRYEGFPNVLIESFSHGCPVVATDCPTGPSEIIDSKDVGLLAEVGNPDDLAEKIILALDRDYDLNKILERANYFSIERSNKKILELFENLYEL